MHKSGTMSGMLQTFNIPDKILSILPADRIAENVRESLVLKAYMEGVISVGKVAELLEISRYDADVFLNKHNAHQSISVDDYNQDLQNLNSLLSS